MRTIDFSQVLFNALQFSGNDRHNIQPETFAQFRDFASTRLREGWEMFEWPDVCRVAPFSTTTADAAAVITDGEPVIGMYYANVPNTGQRTEQNPMHLLPYTEQVPSGTYRTQLLIQNKGASNIELTLAQTGAKVIIYGDNAITFNNYNGGFDLSSYQNVAILEAFYSPSDRALEKVRFFTPSSSADEILAVFDKNPMTSTRANQSQYTIYNDGAKRIVVNLESGWYVYRIKCPELHGDLLDTSIAYSKGAQAYWDEGSKTGTYKPVPGSPHRGNFFECLANTIPGETPSSRPDKWKRVDIPYVFGSYIAWGSTSNWMVSEGMVQEATIIEAKAREALENEFDKATRQQGQFNRLAMVRTY